LDAAGLPSKVVDIFDVSTNMWTTDSLSIARADLGAATLGNLVIFAGGWDGTAAVYKTVDIYDTLTGLWTTDSLTTGRFYAAATSIGDVFMFAGGANSSQFPLNDVEMYSAIPNKVSEIASKDFKLFPNPSSSNSEIKFINTIQDGTLIITDITGKKVYQRSLTGNGIISVSTSGFAKGVYIAKISDGESAVTQKLVIE
jgi:hypothetical protein